VANIRHSLAATCLQGPLATWVEAETCSVMLSHLLMGFELQLYEPADYAMIYWCVTKHVTFCVSDMVCLTS
jgi:hypothetical protein